jgi:hypothetical protein
MQNNNQLAIIAIVAALGVLGVVIVVAIVTIPQQQAEARGCAPNPNAPGGGSIAVNASKGRCQF